MSSRHKYRRPASKAEVVTLLRQATAVDAQGFLPGKGEVGLSRHMADTGLLRSCGRSDAYPHVLYCVTGRGRRYLEANS